MADGTGKVAITSDLKRKKWMREGLIQKSATSWWAAYKGTTKDSIIMQANLETADTGHTVVFDMDGNLSGKPVKGNTTAKGTGEQKKKFSDKVTVSDYRYVVDNGTKFDGKDIGDLSINEHADSRSKLADLWVRSSDQAYFDLGQQGAEFGIDLTTTFTFDQLLDIEKVIKQGQGFDTTPVGITKRLPLTPFRTAKGKPIWLFVVDVAMKNMLMKSSGAQQVLREADIRGNNNALFSGVLGQVGNFVFVEAGDFFGTTSGSILDSDGYYNYDNTGVEMAGMRQYDSVNEVWSGEDGFDITSTIRSRGLILGAGAFQLGMGKMPDYKYEGTDFDKFSESCMEIWCGAKNTKLLAENSDNADGKIAGYNFGSVFVDVTTHTAA
jgi:hypothetical protein